MKKMFPSFDLGISHLFPSEPEEKKQKNEEPHRFVCLDVSELDDVVELKPSENDKMCNKIRSKRFSRYFFASNYYNKILKITFFLKKIVQ